MALIDVINIYKRYGANLILDNVSLNIFARDRIALMGQNGCGKSTLINIILSTIEADDGRIVTTNNLKINYLAQNPLIDQNISVYNYLEQCLSYLRESKKAYDEINEILINDYTNEQLLAKSADLCSILDFYDGWDLDNKLQVTIEQFQLTALQDKLLSLLSGGEQRRVALAGVLLQESDVLILDEPTNHLDVYMVSFLEQMLINSKTTLMFVSHDRYFVDNVATLIVEIDRGKINKFKGGYKQYLVQKNELLQHKIKENDRLLKLLKAEEEWLAKGVKARVKRNEGRKERVLQLRNKMRKNPGIIHKMRVTLQREQQSFNHQNDSMNKIKCLFEINNLAINIHKKVLLKPFSTRILQQDKIAIVGKNGSGKSSFLKALLGQIPFNGEIKQGDFTIGYFDQNKNGLDDNKTLIETFCPQGGDRVEVQGKNLHVYAYLKNFLFPKEFLTKKIGYLSGGEKTRIALAFLLSKKQDCLILDEPTNDLDIATINILEEALANFAGALLIVSHDRYFVDKIADKLFIFDGLGNIEENSLLYSEYLDIEKNIQQLDEIEKSNSYTINNHQKNKK